MCQKQAQNCCIFSANGTLLLQWHCDRLSVDVPLNCFVSLHSPSQHLPSFPALRKNSVRQPVRPTQPRLLQGTSLSELLPYFDFLIGGSFACMVPIKFHDAPLPLASEGCCFSLALPRQQIGAFKVDWIVCGFHLCSISLATCKVCGGLLIFDLPLQCYTSGLVSFAAGSCTCLAPLAITDRFLDCASSNLQCHAVTLQPSCDAVTLEVNATCSLDLATLANELLHVFTLRWVASLLNASPFHFKVLFSQDAFVQSDAGLQLSHRVRVSLLAIPVRTDLGRGRERGRERE